MDPGRLSTVRVTGSPVDFDESEPGDEGRGICEALRTELGERGEDARRYAGVAAVVVDVDLAGANNGLGVGDGGTPSSDPLDIARAWVSTVSLVTDRGCLPGDMRE